MSAGNISSASALSSSRSHVTLSHVRRLSPRSSFNAASTRIRSSRFCRQKRSSLGLEALAFGLEALKESADPCTPLKAAVGGLLCFVNRVEDMVAAAEDAQRIIQRIEQLEDTMMNAVPEDPSTIASSQRLALETFSQSLDKICYDMETLIPPKEGRIRRFFLAKKRQGDLNAFLVRLNEADTDLQRSIALSTNHEVFSLGANINHQHQSVETHVHQVLHNQKKISKQLFVVVFLTARLEAGLEIEVQ